MRVLTLTPRGFEILPDDPEHPERTPGFGWQISPEAIAEIEAWERENAANVAALLARGFLVGAGA